MVERTAVIAALDAVIDPVSGQGLVAAGLVQGLVVAEDRAGFALEVDRRQAAAYAPVRDAAEAALKAIPGMARVSVILTAEAASAPSPRKAGLSRAAVDQGRPKAPVPTDRPAHVRRVLAVASGKGGVGKSTVAVNLAVALARRGLSVGVLDADVYGPSLPTMLGVSGQPAYEDGAIIPHSAHGLKAMSVGLLTRMDDAMIWRGPMASQAITQMFEPDALGRGRGAAGRPDPRPAAGHGRRSTDSDPEDAAGRSGDRLYPAGGRPGRCPAGRIRCSRRSACRPWA